MVHPHFFSSFLSSYHSHFSLVVIFVATSLPHSLLISLLFQRSSFVPIINQYQVFFFFDCVMVSSQFGI